MLNECSVCRAFCLLTSLYLCTMLGGQSRYDSIIALSYSNMINAFESAALIESDVVKQSLNREINDFITVPSQKQGDCQ